jgi:hypothetical protein
MICLAAPNADVLHEVETADEQLTLSDGSRWVRNGWHTPPVSTSPKADGRIPALPERMPKYRPARPKAAEFKHHGDRYRGTLGKNLVKKGRWNDKRGGYDPDARTSAQIVGLAEGTIAIKGGGWDPFPNVTDLTITEWD